MNMNPIKMRGRTRSAWARMAFRAEGPGWRAGRVRADESVAVALYCTPATAAECPYCARRVPPNRHWFDGLSGHGLVVYVYTRPDGSWEATIPAGAAWARRLQAVITRLSAMFPPPAGPQPEEEDRSVSPPRPKGTEEAHPGTSLVSEQVHGGDSASGEVPDAASGGGGGGPRGAERAEGEESGSPEPEPCPAAGGASGAGEGAEAPRARRAGSGSPEGEAGDEPPGRAGPIRPAAEDASPPAPAGAEEATRGDPRPSPEGPSSLPPRKEEGGEWREGEGESGAREWSTVPSPGGAPPAAPEPPEEGGSSRELLRDFSRVVREARRGGGLGGLSRRARTAHGGVTATPWEAQADPRVVARLRALLERLRLGGETEAGPRVDHRKFSAKVAGYLRPVTPADHRLEEGRPALLVLPDVSGSMSAVSRDVLAAALALARTGASGWDVVAVVHSNGFPEWVIVNTRDPEEVRQERDPQEQLRQALRFYERLLARFQVRAVIVCADWDGEWLYRKLAQNPWVQRLIWLDPWSCSRMRPRAVPFPPRHIGALEGWTDEAVRKVRYAFAVGSAEAVADALGQILKNL